jgi:hypothetical protein
MTSESGNCQLSLAAQLAVVGKARKGQITAILDSRLPVVFGDFVRPWFGESGVHVILRRLKLERGNVTEGYYNMCIGDSVPNGIFWRQGLLGMASHLVGGKRSFWPEMLGVGERKRARRQMRYSIKEFA